MMCYDFFGKVSSDVKARLFKTYCTSFYGCELSDLSAHNLPTFCAAWRKGIDVFGICHIQCIVIYCHFYAIVHRYLLQYVKDHLSLYKHVCLITPRLYVLLLGFL